MAEETVRKSGRIKVRNTSYLDDDFDYNLGKFDHEDVPVPKVNKKKTCKQISSQDKLAVKQRIDRKKPVKIKSESGLSTSIATDVIKTDLITNKTIGPGVAQEKMVHAYGTEEGDRMGDDASGLSCPLCAQKLCGDQDLEAHIEQHRTHNPEIQLCQVCSRVCVDHASFTRHMRMHTGDRKFKCDECGKAFLESCSLKRHKRSHGNERPFVCSICLKGFRDSSSFTRHQRTHSSQPRVYPCDLCDKSFMDKHGLKRHTRTHLNFRPFQCSICSKSFSDSCSFKRHQKIHIGIRDFHCWKCQKSFLEKQSLRRHMKNVCGFDGYHDGNSSDSSMNLSQVSMADLSKTVSLQESHLLYKDSVFEDINPTLNKTSELEGNLSLSLLPTIKNEPTPDVTDVNENISEADTGPLPPSAPPSLGRLISHDPSLYSSITGLVDSIDSFEKMMTLVSDEGQGELDVALSRELPPMPDNLLCFECGELLIDRDNFAKEGKDFGLSNSFKCNSCEPSDMLKRSSSSKEKTLEINQKEREEQVSIPEKNYSNNKFNPKSRPVSPASENQNASLLYQRLMESYESATSLAIRQSGNLISSMFNNHKDLKPPPLDYTSDDPGIPSVFPCHLCDKVFASSIFRNQHLKLHKLSPHRYKTPPRKTPSVHECVTCSKTFSNSAGLKRHSLIHLEDKPYKCKTCDRSFSDRSNFTKHSRRCALGSKKTNSKLLNGHNDVNRIPQDHKENALSCQYCNKLFDDLTYLENHQKRCYNTMSDQLKVGKDSSKSMSIRFSYDTVDINDDDSLTVHFKSNDNAGSKSKHISIDTQITNGELPEHYEESHTDNSNVKQEPHSPQENDISTSCHNSDSLACDICYKTFTTHQALLQHMNFHTKNPKVTCPECGKSFFDTFGLKRHMRTHANIRPFTCIYCGRGYCDNWSLKKHGIRGCLETELKNEDLRLKLHPCPQCTRVFSTAVLLNDHMATHKGQLKFECDICEKKFSEAFNLKRHRRLHMAVCPGCDGEFKDITALEQHKDGQCLATLAVTGSTEDGFPCAQCGRTFSTKAYLERHKKFHSGLKPFACQICNKRFSESFGLKRHMRTHANRNGSGHTKENGTIPFTTIKSEFDYDIKTEINEYSNPNLKMSSRSKPRTVSTKKETCKNESNPLDPSLEAMILVTKYGAYECGVCSKTFLKKYMLVRHLSVHSEDRKFSCSICGKAYKDSSSLRRHQLVHKGVKEFVCNQCGKDFCYPDSLRRHLKGNCGIGKLGNNKTVKKPNFATKISTHEKFNFKQISGPSSTDQPETYSLLKALMAEPLKPLKIKMWNKLPGALKSSKNPVSHWLCQKKNCCWRCNSMFSTYEDLLFHCKSHKGHFPFKCNHCYLKFNHKYYWQSHRKKCRKT